MIVTSQTIICIYIYLNLPSHQAHCPFRSLDLSLLSLMVATQPAGHRLQRLIQVNHYFYLTIWEGQSSAPE